MAALAVAVGAVIFAIEIEQQGRENDLSDSAPTSTTPFATSLPNEISTTTSIPAPEFIGPEERLGSGFSVDGDGVIISDNISRGVNCKGSYESDNNDHPPGFNEMRQPLDLAATSALFETDRNILFFGDESGEPRAGHYRLSRGWAIEYQVVSRSHVIYSFEVKPRMGSPRADVLGRPVLEVSRNKLLAGIKLENGGMAFTAKVDTGEEAAGEQLHMTIACVEKTDSQSRSQVE